MIKDTNGTVYPVIFPGAFSRFDTHMIINTATGDAIEGHSSERAAERGRDILNDHELRNARAAVYVIKQIKREE